MILGCKIYHSLSYENRYTIISRMKINLSVVAKYLPLIIGITIIAIGSLFVPWNRVIPYLTSISPGTLVIFFLLGMLFYFGRIFRFWLVVRILGQPRPLRKVALAYLIAQPMSLLPGGELYRSVTLKRYANVSFKNGLPSVFAQSLTESMGLLIIALIGAALLHRYILVVLIVAGLFALIWAIVRWQDSRHSHKLLNKLPKISISYEKVRLFFHKNRILLSGKNFILLLGSSFISIFASVAVLYLAAREFDADLGVVQAAIAVALPVMLQFVTFLPAGLGVNEQGSIAVLALFGVSLSAAVAITIIVRFVTLILGFIFGFIAMAVAYVLNVDEIETRY